MDPSEIWSNIEENLEPENNMGGKPPGAARIFVKTLTKTIKLFVYQAVHTVNTLKEKIQEKEGIPPITQRLIFNGVQLESGQPLMSYGVHQGSTLDLELVGARTIIQPAALLAAWCSNVKRPI